MTEKKARRNEIEPLFEYRMSFFAVVLVRKKDFVIVKQKGVRFF